ncbi:MAG: molybdenum cofactor biosynthesis protein MoaE [Planctomycetota bacterium]|nr:molybdenum cofactor biosynthesis protein MoaE [Planctomycetota bacterium]
MIRIRKEPLDLGAIARSVEDPACGAVATFAGVVRNENAGKAVERIHYEAYEPMARKKMAQIVEEMKERWGIRIVAIEHRIGELRVGDVSVVMAVSSPHRKEAFEAIRYGMDRLKATVPIWKLEHFEDGTAAWAGGHPGQAQSSSS